MSRTEPTLPSFSTPALPPATDIPATAAPWQPAERFLIRNIDWKAYRQIADALGEHHHYRLSYDGRDLELMVKSLGHGMYGRFLGYLIQVLTQVLGLPLRSAGDMTCEREDLERGIEPDECFYIQGFRDVVGKETVDLATDPPPDLGLEIDLTTDSRRRMGIYAALRIPEIWRYEARSQRVIIYVLEADGQYAEVERSRCLPLATAGVLTDFLRRQRNEDENSLLAEFRQWAQDEAKKPS